MRVFSQPAELNPEGKPVCAAIGVFDGLHLGHQQVIKTAVDRAVQISGLSVVITFEPHPQAVLTPKNAPLAICPLKQKLELLEKMGVDSVLLLHFDLAFSRMEAADFIKTLARDLKNLNSISVGRNFSFGYQRRGNLALLEKMGLELGFQVDGIQPVRLDRQPISSTRLRKAIREGHLDQVAQMLGRPYSIKARVLQGDALGRQIGFPTANLDITGLQLPPCGVYSAHATALGLHYIAVVNIGIRPTISTSPSPLRLEAHLLDFQGNLYGEEIELFLKARIRDEKKFSSPQELGKQIAMDIETVRAQSTAA
jgi:riboflavin kinase/FMN adenylyltransferase